MVFIALVSESSYSNVIQSFVNALGMTDFGLMRQVYGLESFTRFLRVSCTVSMGGGSRDISWPFTGLRTSKVMTLPSAPRILGSRTQYSVVEVKRVNKFPVRETQRSD
jgi:hypothetical protein